MSVRSRHLPRAVALGLATLAALVPAVAAPPARAELPGVPVRKPAGPAAEAQTDAG